MSDERKFDDGGLAEDKTLLDYFAGQALAGILAQAWHPAMGFGPDTGTIEERAVWCYEQAAAMVAEKRRREACAEPTSSP